MTYAVITYTDEGTGITFRWDGGAYIDVLVNTCEAMDVINVWDDEQDRSRFELEAVGKARPFRYILEAFEQACEQYLER